MASSGTGTGSPCGACKFLRRKCSSDCVFAPYFSSEQGPDRFAAIHKVFGASNISKLLLHVPVHHRCEAVVTISYEAQERIRDPVYGCVAHIFALQQQVTFLQAQLMQLKAQFVHQNIAAAATTTTHPRNLGENQTWQTNGFQTIPYRPYNSNPNPISPQSSFESIGHSNSSETYKMQEHRSSREDYNYTGRKRPYNCNTDSGELQDLALRMTRS